MRERCERDPRQQPRPPPSQRAGRGRRLVARRPHHRGDRPAPPGERPLRRREVGRREHDRAAPRRSRAPAREHLEALGDPDRPGHQRGEGEADHHRLHHPVGRQEHAPGREVPRQRRGDLGLRRPRPGHARRRRFAGQLRGARPGGIIRRRRLLGPCPARRAIGRRLRRCAPLRFGGVELGQGGLRRGSLGSRLGLRSGRLREPGCRRGRLGGERRLGRRLLRNHRSRHAQEERRKHREPGPTAAPHTTTRFAHAPLQPAPRTRGMRRRGRRAKFGLAEGLGPVAGRRRSNATDYPRKLVRIARNAKTLLRRAAAIACKQQRTLKRPVISNR